MLTLLVWETGEPFAEAQAINVYEKPLGTLEERDFDGHESFVSKEEMYATYRTYYGDKVTPETIVKIIQFKLLKDL